MAIRATKRGSERTPLDIHCDVLICGASFAGLTVARQLAGSGADVVVIDRYEIGERQTSACAAPLPWLRALGLESAVKQEFGEIVAFTPGSGNSTQGPLGSKDRRRKKFSWKLPQPFATFDYREVCRLLAAQGEFRFETAKVEGRQGSGNQDTITIVTDRGPIRAPIVVDALGWRRVLAPLSEENIQPPDAFLSRGLEVHPEGTSNELELILDPHYLPDGYSWVFPAGDEVRVGVGSFDPHHHVKDPMKRLADDLDRDLDGFQGNWIPHRIRPAIADQIFFVGDSAGHCIPLSAEGIRPAFFFAASAGNEIRKVVEGKQTRTAALKNYNDIASARESAYEKMLTLQRIAGKLIPHHRTRDLVLRWAARPTVGWRAWSRYLEGMSPAEVDLSVPAAAPPEQTTIVAEVGSE